jgi:isoleucyl-tRNA synthetase
MIDRWALSKTAYLATELTDALESYELHRAVQLINRFCSVVLSSTYHDIIKDRLYTLHRDDPKRRSTQTAIFKIFETFVSLIGPILPFTADEAWSFHKTNQKLSNDFLILQKWPESDQSWKESLEVEDAEKLLNLKESKINEVLESLRSSKEIGQSLEAELVITCSNEDDLFEILDRRQDQLAELFIVSSVIVKPSEANSELTISAHHAPGVRCPRSWRWVPELVEVDGWGQVSPRCAQVLNKI